MNFNAIHNVLNFLGVLFGALLVFDWQSLGFSPAQTVVIAGWVVLGDKITKIGLNVTRDGIGGLFKRQPPVEK